MRGWLGWLRPRSSALASVRNVRRARAGSAGVVIALWRRGSRVVQTRRPQQQRGRAMLRSDADLASRSMRLILASAVARPSLLGRLRHVAT